MSRFGLNVETLSRLEEEWVAVPTETALEGKKIVCIYFSARWCPPCRTFSGVLKAAYEEILNERDDIEIVFVSSDRSSNDMKIHMKESHGNWLALAQNPELEYEMKQIYNVQGVPKLIVCRGDGLIITKDGKEDIQRAGSEGIRKWLKSI